MRPFLLLFGASPGETEEVTRHEQLVYQKQVYRYINQPGEQVSIGGHCTCHAGDQLQFGFKRKISN